MNTVAWLKHQMETLDGSIHVDILNELGDVILLMFEQTRFCTGNVSPYLVVILICSPDTDK